MVTKQRGSAIIVAVLLISAIGAVGFSFGRVFLSEFANATVHENGIFAYYAAESGIEEGFLRYRYSRDAEVPFANWKMETSTDRNQFNLVNLTNPTAVLPKDKTAANALTSANQYYYLRMGYAGTGSVPFFGQDVDGNGFLQEADIKDVSYGTGDYSYLKIAKDDSYKIDLTNVLNTDSSYDINLFAKFQGTAADKAQFANSIIEAKLIYEINGSTVKEYKTIVSSDQSLTCSDKLGVTDSSACLASALSASPIILAAQPNDSAWFVSNLIQTWRGKAPIQPTDAASKVTLVLKPLFHGMVIGISSGCGTVGGSCDYTANTVVPGPYTTVSSVGTYKGVYRTLEANIDRQSGSLYDLYDYVIYKAKP